MRRKPRKGEVVCRCGVYRFPHRQLGGACNGGAFVSTYFDEQMHGGCRDCHFLTRSDDGDIRCEVLDGRDSLLNCPALSDHIRYHSIPLYGVNRP